MKTGMASLVALALIGASMNSFGDMNVYNVVRTREAAGRSFGFMSTSKHVRKTNKLRCAHNAKLKRRKTA